MRRKDAARLSTVRLLLAAIKQREVDERIELDDAQVLSVIEKMIKQRRESIAQYEKAARKDLADVEKAEIEVLSGYMPAQMSEAEIQKEVEAAIAASGASGVKDMGKVMAFLKPKLAARPTWARFLRWFKSKLSVEIGGVIPDSFKQDLLNRVDIVDVVSRYVS
jgi:uncharacterized protein YqeY